MPREIHPKCPICVHQTEEWFDQHARQTTSIPNHDWLDRLILKDKKIKCVPLRSHIRDSHAASRQTKYQVNQWLRLNPKQDCSFVNIVTYRHHFNIYQLGFLSITDSMEHIRMYIGFVYSIRILFGTYKGILAASVFRRYLNFYKEF